MDNTSQWIDFIITKLFEAETRRLDQVITNLNQRNSEMKGKTFYAFMHQGQRYIPSIYKQHAQAMARHPVPTLAFGLMDEVGAFQADINVVNLDKDQIKQALYRLLHQCNDLQEIRDSLPDCVVALVPDIAKLQRSKATPLWILRGDERAIRQYEKILPKIEMYAMSRLIY